MPLLDSGSITISLFALLFLVALSLLLGALLLAAAVYPLLCRASDELDRCYKIIKELK